MPRMRGTRYPLMGRAAAFSPLSLAPALWLKSDAGLFQERTGAAATTPASADGDPIGTRLDQSSSALHQTAVSNARRPTYKPATANGLPVARFDGIDDYLSATGLNLTGDLSVALVFHAATAPGAGARRMLDLAQAAADGLQLGVMATGQLMVDNSGGPTTLISTAGSVCDGGSHAALVTRSGTTYTLYVDGTSIGTSGGTAPTYTRLFSGTNSAIGSLAACDDCEVVVTASVLTAAQRSSLFAYLRRWGTP